VQIRLTLADKILILVLLAATGASAFAVRLAGEGTTVVIQQNGATVYTLDLHEQRTVTLEGRLGPVVVETSHGRVAITHSSCPNHICVRTGWRSKAGEVIVCVPNDIFVRITGRGEKGIRAVTG
jgi:hypothetical protein